MENRIIISMLVKNEVGVLTRVSGLFARRGFNIGSLSVGETERSDVSRITITTQGDEYVREQMIRQLEKLHDCIIVESLDQKNVVTRELILLKLNVQKGERREIMEAVSIFRAKVVDLTSTTMTIEVTGETSKCDAFVEYLREYGIAELVRTGLTAIERGSNKLVDKVTAAETDAED
jgi:acetolactate synthase-1/3 small subunit